MPDYTVTGTVTPDCTGDYTDAGEYNGQRYYTNEGGTWCIYLASAPGNWGIANIATPPTPKGYAGALWAFSGSENPSGDYSPIQAATGTATVAEYVAPSSNPRLSGVLKLVITHINGIEMNPAKRFELEFDS